jgi:protein SCO1/2
LRRRGAAVLAAAAVAALTAGCGGSKQSAIELRGSAITDPYAATDFALRDQDGRLVRISHQRGKTVVVAFLYTRCPDVCPLIAENLNLALHKLGSKARAVRVLAVSVDPKGDTPAAVRQYVDRHHLLPEFRYLRGDRAQLAPVWKAYGIAADANRLGLVDHTAVELLVDPDGKVRALYDARVRAADVVHDVEALAGAQPGRGKEAPA